MTTRAQPSADEGATKILVNLAWRLRSARKALARAKDASTGTPSAVLASAEGAYIEAWNSLQAAKAIFGGEGEGLDIQTHVLDLEARYRLDGKVWAGHNLQKALACANAIAWAYERAAVENGGDGSVSRDAVDEANRLACDALGVTGLAEIIIEATDENTAKRVGGGKRGADKAATA